MIQAHPLFPPKSEEDDDVPEVGSIRVYRLDGTRRVMVPRNFAPHELTDPGQLHDMYGGGSYLLQARDAAGARITSNQQFDLPGPPKPLAPEPAAPAGAQLPMAGQAQGGGGIDPTTLILAIMQGQQSSNQMMVTMMQESSKQLVAMVTGMLDTSRRDSQTMVQAMGQLSQSAANQQGELFKAMLAAKTSEGGNGQLEAFVAGMQAREEAGLGAPDDGGIGDLMQLAPMLAPLLQGRQDAAAGRPPNLPGAPAPGMAPKPQQAPPKPQQAPPKQAPKLEKGGTK